ncbi:MULTISPECIES: TraR/DksA C4-type zinc finger protein [Pseudomonas]|uniref:TraR/DksA C4-type zinc finger protein n=1 Tax=Pseudomonas TaxID=286 RepID=UPI00041E430A|nr:MULTISPECIES: TraR/DksA C4-type zinc finger protein [Pseudomonas]AZD95322.1 putative Zinc-finger containing protein [Pseudomonas chlororaphis subsp. aureofaciens]KAB0523073.1 TraR/DksA family transcriptional regulator [Pseudomonas chlororaphis subsp. aureofaciens]TSD29370.1 TraR/DksA family transcriptional regulator [Pseudomonas sp. ATCC 13985]WDG47832.1 TraR/DksA C4-type zinc finger protein [Pseudomonas chlororaphis]WDG59983.1 TraR/DksA C4-type zinc finger protein [Pseudomonas chlororaphis
MVCPFDRAQDLEQRQRDQAIAAQLAQARSTGPSLTHCEDCNREIPEARRALGGMIRCVPCQTTFEKGIRR